MPRATTMQDVARLAGVSTKTVSNVLSGYVHVSERMRVRVMAAVEELDYEINVSAQALRSGRTTVLGLAVPELSQPYFAELADAVITAARERGYTVLIEQTDVSDSDEIAVVASMKRHAIAGLIYSPSAVALGDVTRLDAEYPLVVLGDQRVESRADHLVLPDVEAVAAATEHLIGLGRRRIAFLGAAHEGATGTGALRLQGHLEALAAAGLALDPGLIVGTPLWHRTEGAQAVEHLLGLTSPIDAIVCCNDALALGAMGALQRAGLRVPEDVAVIGFDDIEDSRHSTPRLSTVSPHRTLLARRAVELLLGRIMGESATEPVVEQLGFSLLLRESTTGSPAS
ncbi:LacI family transcriptional regulator [Rathayibacter sp. ZW T2_19]|uniref:LacI family transcriptional regulator n=1 Tax=Rathayibacter rubneri TaxID=2950106 RepID=A0A9X2E083_9MICO|nr:LacI family DNA-binding transcriptional regulator [Rathayibacter rubneri]MCM6764242.1 LacI family transcriptional regulator [Rathayibacter rubneri]